MLPSERFKMERDGSLKNNTFQNTGELPSERFKREREEELKNATPKSPSLAKEYADSRAKKNDISPVKKPVDASEMTASEFGRRQRTNGGAYKSEGVYYTDYNDYVNRDENPSYNLLQNRYEKSKEDTSKARANIVKSAFGEGTVSDAYKEYKASKDNSEAIKQQMMDKEGLSYSQAKKKASREHEDNKLAATKVKYDSLDDDAKGLIDDYNKSSLKLQGYMTDDESTKELQRNQWLLKQIKDKGYTEEDIVAMNRYEESLKNAENAEIWQDVWDELYEESPVYYQTMGTIASAGTNVLKALAPVENIIANVTDTPVDKNSPFYFGKNTTDELRGQVTDRNDWMVGNYDVFDAIYGVGTSTLDSVVAGMIMPGIGIDSSKVQGATRLGTFAKKGVAKAANGVLGGGLIGVEAAADTMYDLTERGASSSEAFTGGLVAGAFEGLFESFSIGEFKALQESGKAGLKNIVKDLAISAGVNGSEEGFTEIANIAYDTLANGDVSQYQQSLNNYMANGMSQEEAKKQVIKDMAFQVVEAIVSGAAQGLLMGGSGRAINSFNTSIADSFKGSEVSNPSGLLENIKETSTEKKLSELADKYATRIAEGKKVSNRQLGAIERKSIESTMNAKMDSASFDEILQGVSSKDRNTSQNREMAKIVQRYLDGKTISKNEENIIKTDPTTSEYIQNRESAESEFNKQNKIKALNTITSGAVKDKESTVKSSGTENNVVSGKNAESIKIADIKRTGTNKGENVSITVEATVDGEKVSVPIEEVEFANTKAADVVNLVADSVDLDTQTANYILNAAPMVKGASATMIAHYMNYAYTAGRYNLSEDYIPEEAATILGKDITEQLYKSGQSAKVTLTESESEIAKNVARGKKVKNANVIRYEGKEMGVKRITKDKTLTNVQKGSMIRGIALQKSIGVEAVFYKSKKNEDGKFVAIIDGKEVVDAPNGMYKNGKIYIDVNAGNLGEGTMLFTMSHELTHFIKQWSPAQFRKLADYVLPIVHADTDINYLVDKEIEKSKNTNNPLTREGAEEEIVANALESMLSDDKDTVINNLIGLKNEDEKLFKKIVSKISKWADEIHKFYNEMLEKGHLTSAGRAVAEMADDIDGLRDMFTEALKDAGKNFQSAEQAKNKDLNVTKNSARDNAKSIDRYTEKEYNERGWVAVNEVITIAESKSLYSQFADLKKNKFKYPLDEKGNALIIVNDNKNKSTHLVAIKGTINKPIIDYIIEPVNEMSFNQKYTILEGVTNGRNAIENVAAYESLEGKKLFVFKFQRDYPSFSELKLQRQGSEGSNTNSQEFGLGTGNSGADNESVTSEPSSKDGGFSMPKLSTRDSSSASSTQSYFNELFTVSSDGIVKPNNVNDLSNEDWKLIYKAVNKLGYGLDSVEQAKEVYSRYVGESGFNKEQSEAIMKAYGVGNGSKKSLNPERVKRAKKEYGTTTDFREAGYLLPDGNMLDFSGKREGGRPHARHMDHREIARVFNDGEVDSEYGSATSYMNAFISEGNIRLMETQGVTIGEVEPTDKQYAMLKKFIEHVIDSEGFFYLDLSNNDGYQVESREYDEGDSPSRIVNDIKEYFKNGELPYRSELQSFRYSPRDTEYLELAKNPELNKARLRKMVDEVAKNAGYSNLMYHGSKSSDNINVFRDWQYFTENKAYAERYAGKKLYESYVKINNLFDTRNKDALKIFNEARQEYGLNEVGQRGLPDWTDGYDLSEFIDENELDYDAIVLDEGGDMVNGKPVYRGDSYVIRKSNQIKSADLVTYDDNGNIIPLSERFNENDNDIRYSGRGNGYYGYSMSNNAKDAYDDGEMPLSKWTKSALMEAISEINPNKAELLKKVSGATLRSHLLEYTAWHHTSSQYNKTDFYKINEDVLESVTDSEIKEWESEKTPKKVTKKYKGNINYLTWSGSKAHPKATSHSLKDVNIEERGSFYVVTDDDGNELVRKKIGSNGTEVTNTESKPTQNYDSAKSVASSVETPVFEDYLGERIKTTSSSDVYKTYKEFKKIGLDFSRSGNIYPLGKKPSSSDYQNLSEFFKAGDKRISFANGYTSEDGFVVETWDGSKWTRSGDDIRYSFRGENSALTERDKNNLSIAKEMSDRGDDSEKIRLATGWFKGYDGKWRNEVDDSSSEFDKKGFGKFSRDKNAYIDIIANDSTITRYDEWKRLYDSGENAIVKVEDIYKNDELFNAYPELKDISVVFKAFNNDSYYGHFDEDSYRITLNYDLPNSKLRSTIAHELQHIVQTIEGFSKGGSPDDFDYTSDEIKIREAYKQAKSSHGDAQNDIAQKLGYDSFEQLENAYNDASAYNKYRKIAGEIESWDVENRLDLSTEQRKNTRPDIDRTDVLFADGGASYSIGYTTNNIPVAIVENNILDGVPKSQWIKRIKNTITEKFSNGVPISGRLVKVNKISKNEFVNSKYSRYLKSSDGTIYADKFKTANNLDDVVLASTNYINEDLKHTRSDSIKEFARGDVLIRVGEKDYSAKVIIGLSNSNSMVLYDVVDFNNTTFKLKKKTTRSAMQNAGSQRNEPSSNNSISNSAKNVNRNSVRDSFNAPSDIYSFYNNKIDESREMTMILNNLGENYTSMLGKVVPDDMQIRKLTSELIKQYNSKIDAKYLNDRIRATFDYMANTNILNWSQDIIPYLGQIAKEILEKSEMVDDSQYNADFRKWIRKTKIKINNFDSVKAEFGSWQDMNRMFMGKTILSTKEGTPIDELWDEMVSQSGGVLPAQGEFGKDRNGNSVPADSIQNMLILLDGYFNNTSKKVVNPYETGEIDIDRASVDIGLDLYRKYWDVAKHKDLGARYNNQMKYGYAELEDAKQKLYNEIERQKKEIIANSKKTLKQEIQSYKDARENTHRRQISKNDIERKVRYLQTRYEQKTNAKHIPKKYDELVKMMLRALPFNAPSMGGVVIDSGRVAEMCNMYRLVSGAKGSAIEDMVEENIDNLNSVAKNIDDNQIPFSRLTMSDYEAIGAVVDHIKFLVDNENKLFGENKKETIDAVSTRIRNELYENAELLKSKGKRVARDKGSNFFSKILKPEYLFAESGSDTLYEQYVAIRRGENKQGEILYKFREYAQEQKAKYKYDPRWKDRIINDGEGIKNDRGQVMELTIEEAMSVYALSNRPQGLQHLLGGGIQISRESKSKVPFKKVTDTIDYRLTENDIQKIVNTLTSAQKQYADALVSYMSKDIAKDRNEVTMAIMGIEKYVENYYFPIESSKDAIADNVQRTERNSSVSNVGSSKTLNKNAMNKVIVNGFTDTVNNHIAESAVYCGFAVESENLNRLWNSQTDDETKLLKSVIQETIGDTRTRAMKQFMVDLNSGAAKGNNLNIAERFTSKMKKASVMANISVIVQQPTAVFRAMLYVDPKNFATTIHKADTEEMYRMNGCAMMKQIGYFDVNLGRTVTNWLDEYSVDKAMKKNYSLAERWKQFNENGTLDELAGWGAEKADEITWTLIWNACKKQCNGDLNKACKLFQDTISKTQVYDSVFTKCELMRQKDLGSQMISAFMSEPVTSLNMLSKAIQDKSAGKVGGKIVARTLACYLGSLISNAMLKSLVQILRDDDDEKEFLVKYLTNIADNIAGDVFGMIPYLNSLYSILQGFSVERMDTEFFNAIVDGAKTIITESTSLTPDYEKMLSKALMGISQGVGIPVYNLYRDIKSVFTKGKKVLSPDKKESPNNLPEEIAKSIVDNFDFFNIGGKKVNGKIKKYVAGDYSLRNEILDDAESSEITKAIGELYKDGQITPSTAKHALVNLSYAKYNGDKNKRADTTIKGWNEKMKDN